ncbi:MAG: MaoC family dehydratase [Ferrimicrobium sp.]
MKESYFEDYPVDASERFGPIVIDEEEMVAFAQRYDPQPFHVDPIEANASPFGGLIASGWYSCSIMMRHLVERYLSPISSLGSPGVDELRWIAPIRGGDRLWLHTRVLEARTSLSKPDRGILRTRVELCSESGDAALSMVAINLVLRRPE